MGRYPVWLARLAWWAWLVAALAGCVRLPEPGPAPGEPARDASVLVQAEGGLRPPTGDTYSGDCTGAASGGPSGSAATRGDAGIGVAPGAAPAGAPGAIGSAPGMPTAASGIVITELMSNPAAVADADGEWIELHNPSKSASTDLGGCTLDDGAAKRVIAESLVIPPLGYATLARSEAAGFFPDRTLSFSLSNEADAVAVVCAGVVIDRVAYGAGFPLAAGISMALDPGALDAQSNDAPAAWCLSPTATYAEQGTPGAPNAPCHGDADAGR